MIATSCSSFLLRYDFLKSCFRVICILKTSIMTWWTLWSQGKVVGVYRFSKEKHLLHTINYKPDLTAMIDKVLNIELQLRISTASSVVSRMLFKNGMIPLPPVPILSKLLYFPSWDNFLSAFLGMIMYLVTISMWVFLNFVKLSMPLL